MQKEMTKKYVEMDVKSINIVIIKYALMISVFFVLSKSNIPYIHLAPFACSLYFALLWCNTNLWLTSASFCLGFGLGVFEINSMYFMLSTIIIGIITNLIHKKKQKGYNAISISIYLVLSLIPMLFKSGFEFQNIFYGIIGIILAESFFLTCYIFLGATIKRGFAFKLNLDEIVCGIIFLILLSSGINQVLIYKIELIKIFAVYSILLFCYIYKDFTCMLIAVAIGLGQSIQSSQILYISCFGMYALFALGFKSNKYLSVLGVILIEILLNFYFKVYTSMAVWGILAVVIGCLLFLLTPMRFTTKVNDLLGGYKEKLAVRNVVNRSKQGIKNRMIEVSKVFNEMDSVYRSMVKGVLPIADAKQMLKEEVIEKCCDKCPDKNNCLRANGKLTGEVFDGLINAGFERGKATLLDVPPYLTSKCGRVNHIISNINQLLLSYKHYANMVNNMDASRVLVAEQLNGVSTIIRGLAEELDTNISFDISRENRIIEELSYKNMMCLEALVYEKNATELIVTLLMKTFNLNERILEKVISKVCGGIMSISNSEVSSVSGCVVLTLNCNTKFDIVFGSASTNKVGSDESGDTHSLIKITDGKYLMALCDGMGSGNFARKKSATAISLIENFYKAGFDNETILNSVNKLLSLNNEETFSALDVCVIDLKNCIFDFIKMGATYGFLKRNNETIVIETSGLPLGVLDEMKPHITKKMIQQNDIIILISDGITEAFENKEEIVNYVNNLDGTNPKTIADDILSKAIALNENMPKDDMSVVCVRIYAKV